ncbi:MAG: D-alanyl-lipoteichoic acid biosynthesis protein DltB [Firmicutes bacterium]|nr:D-alanyl-lipoteichoic acid biosynthesis protein DltB [Bacillota bacterium]
MMELYGENTFFILLAVVLIPAFVLGYNEKPLTRYGMLLTFAFVGLALRGSVKAIGCLAVFVLTEFVLAKSYIWLYGKIRADENNVRLSKPLYYVMMLLSIAPLVANKILLATEGSAGLLAIVGISYMTFKAVGIIIEVYDGLIDEVRLGEYLYLMVFFPTLVCGPIDRSRRFNEDIRRHIPRDEYLELAATGIQRILLGMVYKFVIAAIFNMILRQFGMEHTLGSLIIYTYCYGLYLFFDFAGYSLMAIGTGYLLGVKVPDNFNKPFASKDIREFWDRWHISLSHWLRDYVYSRLTMKLMRSGLTRNKLLISGIALMANMLLMGCWHGLSTSYIVYGLYHGVLLVAFEIIRKKSKFYKKHHKERWFEIISWFITMQIVMIGFGIFSGHLLGEIQYMILH